MKESNLRKDLKRLYNAKVNVCKAISCAFEFNKLMIQINKIYETKTTSTRG